MRRIGALSCLHGKLPGAFCLTAYFLGHPIRGLASALKHSALSSAGPAVAKCDLAMAQYRRSSSGDGWDAGVTFPILCSDGTAIPLPLEALDGRDCGLLGLPPWLACDYNGHIVHQTSGGVTAASAELSATLFIRPAFGSFDQLTRVGPSLLRATVVGVIREPAAITAILSAGAGGAHASAGEHYDIYSALNRTRHDASEYIFNFMYQAGTQGDADEAEHYNPLVALHFPGLSGALLIPLSSLIRYTLVASARDFYTRHTASPHGDWPSADRAMVRTLEHGGPEAADLSHGALRALLLRAGRSPSSIQPVTGEKGTGEGHADGDGSSDFPLIMNDDTSLAPFIVLQSLQIQSRMACSRDSSCPIPLFALGLLPIMAQLLSHYAARLAGHQRELSYSRASSNDDGFKFSFPYYMAAEGGYKRYSVAEGSGGVRGAEDHSTLDHFDISHRSLALMSRGALVWGRQQAAPGDGAIGGFQSVPLQPGGRYLLPHAIITCVGVKRDHQGHAKVYWLREYDAILANDSDHSEEKDPEAHMEGNRAATRDSADPDLAAAPGSTLASLLAQKGAVAYPAALLSSMLYIGDNKDVMARLRPFLTHGGADSRAAAAVGNDCRAVGGPGAAGSDDLLDHKNMSSVFYSSSHSSRAASNGDADSLTRAGGLMAGGIESPLRYLFSPQTGPGDDLYRGYDRTSWLSLLFGVRIGQEVWCGPGPGGRMAQRHDDKLDDANGAVSSLDVRATVVGVGPSPLLPGGLELYVAARHTHGDPNKPAILPVSALGGLSLANLCR